MVADPDASDYFDAAPLGILTLAAELELRRVEPVVINSNRSYIQYLGRTGTAEGFARTLVERIATQDSRIFGFGTMCNSYPLTIRLAGELKRLRSDAVIILGGPQASVVDIPTLQAYPFIDYVVRGEADESLPVLLDALSNGKRGLKNVRGLTYREGRKVLRTADSPPVADLDALPFPAFHLDGNLAGLNGAPLEIGRGCPFACTFCSTNDFFRRKFRLKSPGKMIEHMRTAASLYGKTSFVLTHDLFTVDRRRVREFCEAMIASGEGFRWSCSARTDCIDEDMIELMARAGCVGLFYGVETGSPRMQKIVDKHLDVEHAKRMVFAAGRHKVSTTSSLIMGYPEEKLEDLDLSIDFFATTLRVDGAEQQLNLLAPLAGTPISQQYFDRMELHELGSGTSNQSLLDDPVERLMILAHPEIFPNFYLLPSNSLDTSTLLELEAAFEFAPQRLRWLLAAVHRVAPGGLRVAMQSWMERRRLNHPEFRMRDLRGYYRTPEFRWEFGDFVRERNREWGDQAIEALCDCEDLAKSWRGSSADCPDAVEVHRGPLAPGDRPARGVGVRAFELEWDIPAVLRFLKGEGPEENWRTKNFYFTTPDTRGRFNFTKAPQAICDLIGWCDGSRTVDELCEMFRSRYGNWRGFDAETACKGTIEVYLEQGILRISDSVSRDDSTHDGGMENCEYMASRASAS